MNEQAILERLDKIEAALTRIAEALTTTPTAPNYKRSLESFTSFDFGEIGANVVAKDQHGPTILAWSGHEFRRRTNAKYGTEIWFSRADGRDSNGDTQYLRLVTFAEDAEVEPLPAKIAQRACITASPASPHHHQPTPQPPHTDQIGFIQILKVTQGYIVKKFHDYSDLDPTHAEQKPSWTNRDARKAIQWMESNGWKTETKGNLTQAWHPDQLPQSQPEHEHATIAA